MKKLCSLLLSLLLLCSLLAALPVSAAGSLSASASASSVTVGNQVTVTLRYDGGGAPIAALDVDFSYNTQVFQYISCKGEGVGANGSAGLVSLSYYPTGAQAPTSLTITLTLKAIGVGDGRFAVSTREFTNDNDFSSLGKPEKTLSVNAINPTKSSNANLASLLPSSGTLTPKFSPGTTSYTIKVPYDTTSLALTATTQDKNAKVTSVSGSNALSVGQNTRVITVTAQSGTTKKYTVVITRSPKPNERPSVTETTRPTVSPDALQVTVGEQEFTIADTQPAVQLPTNFTWSTVTVNNLLVSAAKHEKADLLLLYLTPKDSKQGSFYIYSQKDGQFSPFRPFAVTNSQYVLLDIPKDLAAPTGTYRDTLTYEGGSVSAFVYQDTAQEDFFVVYAIAPSGHTGLYVYDRFDGSLQRYREVEKPMDVIVETPIEQTPLQKFFTDTNPLLLAAIGCGAAALLLGLIALILGIRRKRRNGKH